MKFVVQALVLLASSLSFNAQTTPPRVFLWDVQALQSNRERVRQGDTNLAPALAELKRDAATALRAGPFSVTEKTSLPPSGDKHDYMSVGPYWWPNPNTSNGLPYVRRDGSRNPANVTSDRRQLGSLISNVETLALAYYFTGEERYAERAGLLLRTWFLDPRTRMNPNFEFAQAVPGVNTGRGIGLIESSGLTGLVDGVGLLAGSKAWAEADQRELQAWFAEFLRWMQESKNGRDEAGAKNNHGTYYDLQIVSFALFVGRNEVATNVLRAVGQKRIAVQVEPDGRQPLELARTNAWGYSTMNLRGLMSLATLGELRGVDLWHFETPDGRSIRKALDCLVAFANGEREWLQGRDGRPSMQGLDAMLRTGAKKYSDARYRELVSRLSAGNPSDRNQFLRTPSSGAE